MAYDVFQWVNLMLRCMVLIAFAFFSHRIFAQYSKFKDSHHSTIVKAVSVSLFLEIVLRTIALVGVEAVYGDSYGSYIA